MQSSKVKAGQLWGKNKDELAKQLEELKLELNALRVQKISSGASTKTQRMCVFENPDIGLFVREKVEDMRHGTKSNSTGHGNEKKLFDTTPQVTMGYAKEFVEFAAGDMRISSSLNNFSRF